MSVKSNIGVVTDGLVFYVDAGNDLSYPGSGTTWSDLIGGNDGTLTNSPTYDSSNGGSVVFDGVNDYSISTYTGTTGFPFTISCWVKLDTNSTAQTVLSMGDASSLNQFLGLATQSNGTNYVWTIYNYGTSYQQALSTVAPTLGQWYNVVGVYESNTSKKLYVDGVNVANLTTSALVPTGIDNVTVGRFTRTTPGGYTDGSISCASIYNKALLADEVTQNYNALKNRFI